MSSARQGTSVRDRLEGPGVSGADFARRCGRQIGKIEQPYDR
jgi:hypothetical protein